MNKHTQTFELALAIAAVFVGPSPARADHVALRNGDSLTGAVAAVSRSALTIDTELAGQVTIRWDVVSSLTSTTPVRVTSKSGQTIDGTLAVAGGRISVQRTSGPAVSVDLAATRTLTVITRGDDEDVRRWHGAVNGGVDVSRGNSETSTMSANGSATRLGPIDRLGLFGNYLFSGIGSGADAETTARAIRGGGRYDHDFGGPLFGFGFGEVENNPLQLLDLRMVGGGGLGAHAVKTALTQFNVFGGVSYARDAYVTEATATTAPAATDTSGPPITPPGQGGTPPGQGGSKPKRGGTPPSVVRTSPVRSVGEFLVGQDLTHQLSNGVSLTESLVMYPAIQDVQDYRVSFDLSLSVQLNGWLQWNATVADRYLNIPPAGGAVQNDLFVSTSLGVTFGLGARGGYAGVDGRRPPPARK